MTGNFFGFDLFHQQGAAGLFQVTAAVGRDCIKARMMLLKVPYGVDKFFSRSVYVTSSQRSRSCLILVDGLSAAAAVVLEASCRSPGFKSAHFVLGEGFLAGMGLDLAATWEKIATVRGRFRRQLSWLQWPLPSPEMDLEDLHAPSTRAIELNVEVLRAMVVDLQGCSVDVKSVEKEA